MPTAPRSNPDAGSTPPHNFVPSFAAPVAAMHHGTVREIGGSMFGSRLCSKALSSTSWLECLPHREEAVTQKAMATR